jgi:hypothetical protein
METSMRPPAEFGDIWLSRPILDSVVPAFPAGFATRRPRLSREAGMIAKFIGAALIAGIVGNCVARAAEPIDAGPEEVAKAYVAARDAGNVDAAVAFFSSDSVLLLTGGAKFATRDELRRLHELFAHEHVHSANLRTVIVKDNTIILTNNVSTVWLSRFGFSGMPVYEIMRVDGNQITSLIAYYPVSSLLKMEQACRDKPEVTVPTRPCAEVMPKLRAHTERLIAEGIAESE